MPDTSAEARPEAALDKPRAELYDAVSRWGAGANPEEVRQAIARFEVAAIEVGADRVWRAGCSDHPVNGGPCVACSLEQEVIPQLNRRAEAEVTRLRGALEPFAALADAFERNVKPDDAPAILYGAVTITLGDLRQARALLDEGSEGGD